MAGPAKPGKPQTSLRATESPALPVSFGLACLLLLAPQQFPSPQQPREVSYTSGKDFSPPLGSLEINPWQEGFTTPLSKDKSSGQGRTGGSGVTQTCCWGSEWQSLQGFVLRVGVGSPPFTPRYWRGLQCHSRGPERLALGYSPAVSQPYDEHCPAPAPRTLLLALGCGGDPRPAVQPRVCSRGSSAHGAAQGCPRTLTGIYPLGAWVKSRDSVRFGGAATELWGE